MELRIIQHGVVDSSNERAFAAIADGSARHGDLHVAAGQTAGRGRRGSTWVSPEGEGLYASLVVAPPPPAPHPAALTMAAGLAVHDSVRALGVLLAELKWPNDVEVREAKLAGILVEARGLDADAPRLVVGVGLNCLQREFPPELIAERDVTSLALQGCPTRPEAVLEFLAPRLTRQLDQALADPEGTAAAYLDVLGLRGGAVRVRTGDEELHGRLTGLGIAAGLTLEPAVGEPRSVALAHVRAVEPDPDAE
jgi:BirA family biotin operon repressor/biotin-[acetyl-CoA-carboxylase] ligase